jgi:four helix bundle protein
MERHFAETELWRRAMEGAGTIWRLTASFPPGEREGLTEPLRFASREVAGEIARAWRRRGEPVEVFRALCLAETLAEETAVWLRVAERCGYITAAESRFLKLAYERVRELLRRRMRRPVAVPSGVESLA